MPTMFFLLSKLLDHLVSPVSWVLALLTIAVIPWKRERIQRFARRAPTLALAILVVFSQPGIANRLWYWLEHSAPKSYKSDRTYDVVVVLGGYVEPHASASSNTVAMNGNVERLLVAFDLVRRGRARRVLVSGGMDDPALQSQSDALLSAQTLLEWGLRADQIVLESRSRNTHENALFSAEILRSNGWEQVLLVTSAFHMHRALGCFRERGLNVDTLPVDYRSWDPSRFWGDLLPRAAALEQSTAALREWTGRLVYRLRGYSR